jgi:cytosine deaminase
MAVDLLLRNARVRGREELVDIAIDDGRIAAVGSEQAVEAGRTLECDGMMIVPGFTDIHLHLDKTLLYEDLRPDRWLGSRAAIRVINREQRKRYTIEDILERATQVVEQCIATGTTYIRAFTDVEAIAGLTGVEALLELRSRYADEITIDVAIHPQDHLWVREDNAKRFEEAVAAGIDVVGGLPSEERTPELVRRHVDFSLELAKRYGIRAHLFVDDSDDPSQRALEYLAWRTIEEGLEGLVVAGHCGALSAYDHEHAMMVMRLVAEAGISICVNPHISLCLAGRQDRAPVRRGTTRVRELIDHGVNMVTGQDDVDDMAYPLGRGDMLEVAHYMAHVCHMLWPSELETVIDMATVNGARAAGLERYGIEAGCDADLVCLGRSSLRGALADMPLRPFVIARGRVVAESTQKVTRHRAG